MSNDATTNTARTYREQGVIATVHRACTHCGAPGKFLALEFIRDQWPECYVPETDARHDQPVGDLCPKCKKRRNPSLTQHLGEIWRKRFT